MTKQFISFLFKIQICEEIFVNFCFNNKLFTKFLTF